MATKEEVRDLRDMAARAHELRGAAQDDALQALNSKWGMPMTPEQARGFEMALTMWLTHWDECQRSGTSFPCVIDTDHIILAESETKVEQGCYPYTVILVMRAKAPCRDLPFVTWMSAQTGEGRSVSGGHYDMSLSGACYDYLERCRCHGLNPGKVFGEYILGPKPSKKEKKQCGSTR